VKLPILQMELIYLHSSVFKSEEKHPNRFIIQSSEKSFEANSRVKPQLSQLFGFPGKA